MNTSDQYLRPKVQTERPEIPAPLVHRPVTVGIAVKNVSVAYLKTAEDGTETMTSHIYQSSYPAAKFATQTMVQEAPKPTLHIPEFAPGAPAPQPAVLRDPEAAPAPQAANPDIQAALVQLDSRRNIAELEQMAKEIAAERANSPVDDGYDVILAGNHNTKEAIDPPRNGQFEDYVDSFTAENDQFGVEA